MSEITVTNPGNFAKEMYTLRQQEAMVDAFVDIDNPESMAEFQEGFLDQRPEAPTESESAGANSTTDNQVKTNAIMDMYPHDLKASELELVDRLKDKNIRYLAATYRGLAASEFGGDNWEAKKVEDMIVGRLSDYAEKHKWSNETAENHLNQVLTFMHGKPKSDEEIENEMLEQQRILDEMEAKTPLELAEADSQKAFAEVKELFGQDTASVTQEKLDDAVDKLEEAANRYWDLRDDLSKEEKDEQYKQLQLQIDQLIDGRDQGTGDAEAAATTVDGPWADLEKALNDDSKQRTFAERYKLIHDAKIDALTAIDNDDSLSEEERDIQRAKVEEDIKPIRFKALEQAAQNSGNLSQPDASVDGDSQPDTSSPSSEVAALMAEKEPLELEAGVWEQAAKFYTARKAGASVGEAQKELKHLFEALARKKGWDAETSHKNYQKVVLSIKTGKKPDGSDLVQPAPEVSDQTKNSEGSKVSRWRALRLAARNPFEASHWRDAFGNKEGNIISKKRAYIGAAALAGTGILLLASYKNGWGFDALPVGDGDGMDLNSFNRNSRGGDGLDILPFGDGDGVDLNVNDNVPAEQAPTEPSAGDTPPSTEAPVDTSTFTYPIEWAEANGLSLHDLHELSEKAREAGENVKWHGSGEKEWLEINDQSSTDYIVNTLNKFRG